MADAPQDPQTAEEWQEAVDTAHACLVLNSAKQYGLVTGGPGINVERCLEILRRGHAKGVYPSPNCVERFIAALDAEGMIDRGDDEPTNVVPIHRGGQR